MQRNNNDKWELKTLDQRPQYTGENNTHRHCRGGNVATVEWERHGLSLALNLLHIFVVILVTKILSRISHKSTKTAYFHSILKYSSQYF